MSSNRRLFWSIVDKIEALIDSGAYSAGSRLPPERELAETFKASYLPFNTAFLKGSVAALRSFFATFLADKSSSKIIGKSPFLTSSLTKYEP